MGVLRNTMKTGGQLCLRLAWPAPHMRPAEQGNSHSRERPGKREVLEWRWSKSGSQRKAHAWPCTPAQGICHACQVPETRRLGSKQGQQHDGGSRQGWRHVEMLVTLQQWLAASRRQALPATAVVSAHNHLFIYSVGVGRGGGGGPASAAVMGGCRQHMQQAGVVTAASARMQRPAPVATSRKAAAAVLLPPCRSSSAQKASPAAHIQVGAQELHSLCVAAMHVSKCQKVLPEVGRQGVEQRWRLGLAGQQQHLCPTTASQEDLHLRRWAWWWWTAGKT